MMEKGLLERLLALRSITSSVTWDTTSDERMIDVASWWIHMHNGLKPGNILYADWVSFISEINRRGLTERVVAAIAARRMGIYKEPKDAS